jgi:hypothetical protein
LWQLARAFVYLHDCFRLGRLGERDLKSRWDGVGGVGFVLLGLEFLSSSSLITFFFFFVLVVGLERGKLALCIWMKHMGFGNVKLTFLFIIPRMVRDLFLELKLQCLQPLDW